MKKVIAAVASIALTLCVVQPANALFGVGDIVLDPSNLAQNLLTAARMLQSVNNQLVQLQNEARMLLNEADNLKSLNFSSLARIQASLAATQRLFNQASGMGFQLTQVQQELTRLYPAAYNAANSHAQMNADQDARRANTREALATAMQMQGQSQMNFSQDASIVADLITQSQSAVGNLQAIQASNQLAGLQARQLIQGQELQIAHDRADALQRAQVLESQERAIELRRRFMSRSTAYTPQNASVFN
jgi:type IV secretion system protein TrbJ